MSFPANWAQIPVSGTYTNLDGTPASGYVRFQTEQVVIDGSTVVPPRDFTFTLDANGSFSGTLPATDDPDITPTGWQYRVTEGVTNGRDPFYINVPYNSTGIDMASVSAATPVAPASVPPATSPLTGAETFVGTQSSKSVEVTVDQIATRAFLTGEMVATSPSGSTPNLLLQSPNSQSYAIAWEHNDPNIASKFFWGQNYDGNGTISRNDPIWGFGYNRQYSASGATFDLDEPEWFQNFETYWEESTENNAINFEWYMQFNPVLDVQTVTVTAGGSGYTSAPTVTFSASPTPGGRTATGTATISGGAVTGITITDGGNGYYTVPTISFSGGGGTGATATANVPNIGVGGPSNRPFYAHVTRDASTGYPVGHALVSSVANKWQFGTTDMGDGTTGVAVMTMTDSAVDWLSGITMYFAKNDVWALMQMNAAGGTYINLLKVDANDYIVLGQPSTSAYPVVIGSQLCSSTGENLVLKGADPTNPAGVTVTSYGNVGIGSPTAVYSPLSVGGTLYLEKANAPATHTTGGTMYVDTSGNLQYLSPGGTTTQLAAN